MKKEACRMADERDKEQGFLHTMRQMAWAWRFIAAWKVSFALCAAVSLGQNALLSLAASYLTGQTAELAARGDFSGMLRVVGMVGLAAAVAIPLLTAANARLRALHLRGLGALRKEVFRKLAALPVAEAGAWMSGDLSTRLTVDASNAASLFGLEIMGNRSIFSMAVSIVAGVALSIAVLPAIALPCLTILPLSFALNLWCIRREFRAYQSRWTKVSALTQRLIDAIAGSAVIRLFGMQGRQRTAFLSDADEAYRHGELAARYDALRSSLSAVVQWGATMVALFVGGLMIEQGTAALSSVTFAVMLQSQINNDVLQILNRYGGMQSATVSTMRLRELLGADDEEERSDAASADLASPVAIALSDVVIGYGEGEPVIKGLSLTVGRGEHLAIVGASGGGKTTLIRYLMEFVQAQGGSLALFGVNSQALSQRALRALSAYVPQNCYLFDGTIGENIAWGNRAAPPGKVEEAIRDAGLEELIKSLPKGLDTRVGERGTQLSGGQRQRVAIARAMLKDAPLLLLDEATSALDGESERQVQEALARLMRGRTSVVIAHRLSTIRDADMILVMNEGNLVGADCAESLWHCGAQSSSAPSRLLFPRN